MGQLSRAAPDVHVQPYFFSPAVQFKTTVIGFAGGARAWGFTRERRPSRLGT